MIVQTASHFSQPTYAHSGLSIAYRHVARGYCRGLPVLARSCADGQDVQEARAGRRGRPRRRRAAARDRRRRPRSRRRAARRCGGGRGGGRRRRPCPAGSPHAQRGAAGACACVRQRRAAQPPPCPKRLHPARPQAKLDALCALADAGRVRDFCAAFVPLDLSAEDAADFASGLEADRERCEPMRASRAAASAALTPSVQVGGDGCGVARACVG